MSKKKTDWASGLGASVRRLGIPGALTCASFLGGFVAQVSCGGKYATTSFALEPANSTTPGCGAPIEAWLAPGENPATVDWAIVWNRVMDGDSINSIDPIRTDSPELGCTIYFGDGTYVFQSEMMVSRRMVVVGQGPLNTELEFEGSNGIYVCSRDSCTGTRTGSYGGQESAFRDLSVHYASDGSDNSEWGVLLEARARFEHLHVYGFPGIGIRIDADVTRTPETNANTSYFEFVRSTGNGSHGWHFKGGDSNEVVLVQVSASSNDGWGFSDESFLGTRGFGVHAANNGAGAVQAVGNSQGGLWIMYNESDNMSDIDAPNIALAPRANFVSGSTPALIDADYSGLLLGNAKSVVPDDTTPDARFHVGSSDPNGAWGFSDDAFDTGIYKFIHWQTGGNSNTWQLAYKGAAASTSWGVTDKNHFRGAGYMSTPRGTLLGQGATAIRFFVCSSAPAVDNSLYKTGDTCLKQTSSAFEGWRYDSSGGGGSGAWVSF